MRIIEMEYHPNHMVTLTYSDGSKETMSMQDILIRDVEQRLAIRRVREALRRRRK